MEAAGGIGFVLLFVALFAVLIATTVLWVVALVDVAKAPDHAFRMANTEKLTWVLVVVLVGQIGALVWWFGPRRRVRAAAAAYPLAPVMTGPPPGWYPDPRGGPGQAWWDGHRWSGPPS